MANTNKFPGLARGPLDHEASFVVNVIADETIDMGSVVSLVSPAAFPSNEILPRVRQTQSVGTFLVYGIAVGGDRDGIYGDGSASADEDDRFVAAKQGESVIICTNGRCLARVKGPTNIGGNMGGSDTDGVLQTAAVGQHAIVTTLNSISSGDTDMILVDVHVIGRITG